MELNLEGKVAIVTGVGPNIGSGIALALAAYGARVACNDMVPAVADEAVQRIAAHGGEAIAIPGDVTSETSVSGYVDDVLEQWGKVDIVINNAALMGRYAGVLDEDAASFSKAVAVSGLGCLLNTKYAARSMAERGIRGSIVCVSSSSGWLASPGYISYSFLKGGVNNFVRGAAMDLAPYGIRVNSFSPTAPTPDNPALIAARAAQATPGKDRLAHSGPTDPRSYHGIPDEAEPWRRSVRFSGERPPFAPMGSTGTPTDIGHMIAWLCSDYARLITGCDFTVDGGLRAKNAMHIPAASEELAGAGPLVDLFRATSQA